jgi:c-di-GMP-binding flagellar brake protein YcgR
MEKVAQNPADNLKSLLAVNDTLQLRTSEENRDQATYYSRINDISQGKLVIAWPTSRGIRLIAYADQMLDFYFVRDGTPYSFSGLVDETSSEPLPQVTIILSSPITTVQRRQNFRIKCLLPVEIIGNIKEDAHAETITPLSIRTTSYDLSASGISIRHGKRIPEDSLLTVKISLPDEGAVISIPGSVIYSEYLSENKVLYRTGIRYLAITEKERARIVRFVYRKQLQGLHP